MTRIEALVETFWDAMLKDRRWLHAHPELSGQEEKSAAYIAAALREMGLSPAENVGGYGVTALIQGKAPGRCVALRADFDALPIEECSGLPFASEHPGVCHACGHDAHAAMLLGAARILKELRGEFNGTVKLIFQPSEENSADSGAKKMIEDGVLLDPPVEAIIGQHMSPNLPTGTIQVRAGAVSAASDRFFITVQGKSCHAAAPHNGVDAIVVGAQIITALQSIVSRTVAPLDSTVLTIGKACGGDRYNVLAETFEMEGTCRNLNPEIRDAMPERMEKIIRGVAEGMGATYSFRYVKGYPPQINHRGMFELILGVGERLLGRDNIYVPETAGLGGEDFAFYSGLIPGVFYRVGCHREGEEKWPLHNGHLRIDEEAMKVGARVMVTAALDFLKTPPTVLTEN